MKTPLGIGGCLLIIVLLTSIAFGIYYFINKPSLDLVNRYASSKPHAFSRNVSTRAEAQLSLDLFETCIDSLISGSEIKELSLSDNDLNALLEYSKSFSKLRGMGRVMIHNNHLTAEIRVPLGIFNNRYQDKFLNGIADLKAVIIDSKLQITIDRLVVSGKPLPEEFMNDIRKNNLIKQLYEDPILKNFLNRVKTVRIEKNCLVFQFKSKPISLSSDIFHACLNDYRTSC